MKIRKILYNDSCKGRCLRFLLSFKHCEMTGFNTLNEPLTVEEMLELDTFLISERSSGNSMSIDALDGFFTALVVGPVSVLPSEWIPLVLGTEQNDAFSSVEEAQRVMQLLMRYMNSLIASFHVDAEQFVPIYECCKFEKKEDEDAAATSWALGFILGIELRFEEWKPIFDVVNNDVEEEELILSPIILLSGHEHEAHELTAEDREILKELVGESVMNIFRFWLPTRESESCHSK